MRTRVGYAGGTTRDPTYHNLADHTETLQIDFDPEQISYDELLEVFWSSHDATMRPWSTQYASMIFYHDEGQRRLAEASKERREARLRREIQTEIRPYTRFYLAEDYHQKYYLQQVPGLQAELASIYPDFQRLVDSKAAARVNGSLGGHGSYRALQETLSCLGLSPSGNERVLAIGRRILPDGD